VCKRALSKFKVLIKYKVKSVKYYHWLMLSVPLGNCSSNVIFED